MKTIERILNELYSEEACVWFTEEGGTLMLIIKAPLNSCKAILYGCQVEVLFGIDNTLEKSVIHTGIRIYDDLKNPLVLTSTQRFSDENENLISILSNHKCSVVLYSELGTPMVYGEVLLEEESSNKALKLIRNANQLYIGEFTERIQQSLDSFDYSLDNSRQFKSAYNIDIEKIESTFLYWNSPNQHFVGLRDQEVTELGDNDEGGTLERHIWFALESVFPFEIFLSPKFISRSKKKEVTDILSFYDLGIFLFEAKSLSTFSGAIEKSMERKVLSVQKHIKKAINQLVGAVENMERGTDFFDSKGNPIIFNRDIAPHCIVLVAELFHFGNWKEIELMIRNTMAERSIYLHVFDLRELVSLLKISRGRKEHFDYCLMQRAERFIENQSIHIRTYIEV